MVLLLFISSFDKIKSNHTAKLNIDFLNMKYYVSVSQKFITNTHDSDLKLSSDICDLIN